MQFGVLGPLLIREANGPVTLTSAKQRALLAILLLETPHNLVPASRLIDELWGQDPPATAAKALQVHVSQLRRTLGPQQPIVTRPNGYALHIDPMALDLHRFDALLAQAREERTKGNLDGALRSLQEALGLWRGPALADVTLLGPSATEADRLEGLCAVAHEERMELELARGGGAALVPELEALIASDPYREHMHGLLMLALYRAGRQADALEAFQRARKVLIDELGIEPGPELTRLQEAILAQDPALQLATPAAPGAAGSPTSPAISAARIPRVASSILGRESELRAALELIQRSDVRLVTLTGTGGIGKTRLALELATAVSERAYFVELAAIDDPERVLLAVASALGIEDGGEDAVVTALTQEPVVLFLDNFEQVTDAAPVIASLLAAAPPLTVVVTSRATLRIAGEHELPVPPLAPDSAVELFVRRAREHDPSFEADPDDRQRIAEICTQVDRLPLAIELAAARIRVLTPGEILDRIGRRLDLLSAGRRDAPERHRTLRATIAWSHDLLDVDARQLFEQLAVFHAGWSLEACESVAGCSLDTLSMLVDHSLVLREESRFRMLETVREYAAELLAAAPEARTIERRHAQWCLALAEAAAQELEGSDQTTWFTRLDVERENLRAAAAWGVINEEPEVTLELYGALWRYWLARGAAAEVRGELCTALATGRGEPKLRATALNAAGVLAGELDDFPAARSSFEQALELAAQLDDPRQVARTLMNLGVIAVHTADYATAVTRYQEAGKIWQELGDTRGQSVMAQNLAVVYELMGKSGQAMPLLEQSVELARAAGDGLHVAQTLVELGKYLVQHRPADERIPTLLREGLELASGLGDQRQIAAGLDVLAALNAQTGAPIIGAELIGAADAERARDGVERKPEERPLFESTVSALERALGRDGYERARDRGAGRSLQTAVALALKSIERTPGPARSKSAKLRVSGLALAE
jgi:predicted ATPase/DNA-binding SARP family transcriptional activator